MKYKSSIMNEDDVKRALIRLSHQIIEKNRGTNGLCLIGIRSRGVPIAKRIEEYIKSIEGVEVPTGELDITLYRDDLSKISQDPVLNKTNIPFDVEGKTVVLVDDVIFTGRTARAAMEAVIKQGRPARIQLAVLIDRGHTELPIKADFVGKNIPTSMQEIVAVRLREYDNTETGVTIWGKTAD